MESSSIGHKAAKGAVWAAADRFGTMGIQFIVNLILARILVPEDFGIIGMLAIFIAVSQTLVDGGFTSALIQKKNPTQTDYSTIFYWNTALSIVLYIILFVSAPLISYFYRNELLTPVLRIIGLSLVLNAVNAIILTRLRKELSFGVIASTNILAYVFSGALAIALAYSGWGVWSLVIMQLASGTCILVILLVVTRWFPSGRFSKESFKSLFNFGGYILAANVLQTACQNLQGPIIGRMFSATQMGYFSQAYKLDQITSYSLPQIIVQVMYPVYSSLQDDVQRLRQILLMNIRVISFVVFPILGLLMISSESLIGLLYGEKWLPCAPYFSIFCVGGLFACLQNVNFYVVAAVGQSRLLFLWSFYKWGFLIVVLALGALGGMNGLLWAMVISNLNIYIVNASIASKYVGMRLRTQLMALFPAFMVLGVSLACSYILIAYTSINSVIIALCFIAIYFLGSVSFNKLSVKETVLIFKKIINRK